MNKSFILEETEKWVWQILSKDTTGHDFWHVHRVVNLAEKIAAKEGANVFVCRMAALLHDVADEKLVNDVEAANNEILHFMNKIGVEQNVIQAIWDAMKDVSFKGNHKEPTTLEGKVVQDADRLDAIGAIGVARTFAYGGSKGHKLHDPDVNVEDRSLSYRNPNKSSIHHFYEKLLKLKDFLNTSTAKAIAEKRHRFMENFLEQFYEEWNGTD
jgi:uncharacterized protein